MANYLLLLCLTDPDEKDVHKRHSAILIDTNQPGYEATKIHGKPGIRASNTTEISLSNVEAPTTNLVGKEGRGFHQLMDFFNKTRNHVAAQGVGVAQGALELAISHVKKRKAFGATLSRMQGIQFILAEMATRIEAARSLCWRAAYSADKGKPDPMLIVEIYEGSKEVEKAVIAQELLKRAF